VKTGNGARRQERPNPIEQAEPVAILHQRSGDHGVQPDACCEVLHEASMGRCCVALDSCMQEGKTRTFPEASGPSSEHQTRALTGERILANGDRPDTIAEGRHAKISHRFL